MYRTGLGYANDNGRVKIRQGGLSAIISRFYKYKTPVPYLRFSAITIYIKIKTEGAGKEGPRREFVCYHQFIVRSRVREEFSG